MRVVGQIDVARASFRPTPNPTPRYSVETPGSGCSHQWFGRGRHLTLGLGLPLAEVTTAVGGLCKQRYNSTPWSSLALLTKFIKCPRPD